jgi:hypothetical protein
LGFLLETDKLKWRTLGILFLIIILSALGSLYVFLFTERGLRWLTSAAVSAAGICARDAIRMERLEGDILEGIVYRNLMLVDIKGFPPGSRLTAGRLLIHVSDVTWQGLTVIGEDVGVHIPGVGLLNAQIRLRKGQGSLEVQAQRLEVPALLALFPQIPAPQGWSAFSKNLNIRIAGRIEGEWEGTGECLLADVRTSIAPVGDTRVEVKMNIKTWGMPLFWKGEARLSGSEQTSAPGTILLRSARAQWIKTHEKILTVIREVDVMLPVFPYVPVNSRLT